MLVPRSGVRVKAAQVEDNITMTFLKYRVLSNLRTGHGAENRNFCITATLSPIFSWITSKRRRRGSLKSANIKLLVDQIAHGKQEHMLHIAAHLSNLVKVSEHVGRPP